MKRFFALLLLGTLIFGLGSNAVWAATMSEKTSTEAPVAIAPLPPIALPLSTDVLVPSSEKSFSSLDALLSVPIIPTPEAIAPLVFPATTNFADPIIPELGVSAAKAVNNDEVIADPLEPQRDSELPRGVGQQAWRTMGNSGPGQYNFLQNFTGSFATDLFTGAATFQYPLWVPAGRLGLTPAVTLSYSTNEAKFDSFAGYGWSFPTNAIYRSTRHGSDQLFERNDFTANISGNSQELIVVNQQAGLYGAKLESSFVKYEFSNNYWLATDTKGNQYTFGASDETRQTDPENNAHVYKWLLERVEDRNGNFITYTYFHDRGQVYPETIRYTGHGDDPGLFEVRFIRKGRPNITSYERGFEVETRFIVDRVNVYSYQTNQAVEVMSYRFSHEERNNAIVHLRSIQAQAANDQAAIMPPVTFSYYDGAEQEAGKKNNFLKEVVFPYGARQTFFYSPAATQRLAGGGLANHLPFTVFTLSESRLYPTPNGEAQVTQYNYEGGYYYFDRQDAFKKEYAGFHIVTVIDPAGNVGKTYFHQSEFSPDNEESAVQGEFEDHISKKGKVYREEQYDNAGHLFQKTIQTWDKLALADDDADVERFFVFLRQEVTSDYDGNQDNKSRASAYQYDAYGNVTRQTDFGDATLLNERGDFQDIGQDRSEVITDYALNEEAYIVALPSHAIKKDFLQNTVGEERFYYDGLGLGQVERGNITRQETRMLPDGGDPGLIWNISRQEYNAYGLPIRSVNPRGFAMQISYDQWNLYPVLTTNARGQVTQSTYDLVFGMPTIVTDPNGARQVTILDGLGRVRSKLVSNPAGGPDILTTSYNYQLENYPRSIQVARHFWPGALVVDQWTYLDGLGREIQTRSKMEEADQYSVVNKFYDVQGNLLKETLPLFGNGTGFSAQNINDTGNLYAYDALSRLVSVTNPLGVTRTSYDQWQQTITDPNNKHKDFVFDAFGRLTQVREYLGDAAYPTNYQYDANNNLTKIINAKNEIKSFAYDLAGRKIQEEDFHLSVDPTFSVWQYSYDQNNNLTSTIRPDGEQVRFAYDELDRQLTENWVHQVNRADPIETAYVYDLGVNSIGRLSSVRFLAGSKSFNHDRLGRVIQQRLTIGAGQGAQNFDLAFTYDIAGNNLTTTYPNGVVARNIYNNGGLLESVLAQEPGQAEQIIISGTKYLPNGSVGTRDFANGISTFNQYDINQMNRLIHKTTRRANDGVNLQDLNYTYDPVGNITRIIDASATNAAKTANYQYDDLDRLTRAEITNAANNQNYTQSFSYDITGNIITFGPQNGPYEYAGGNTALAAATFASPQAVTKIGGNQNFTYDRNGNLTGQTAPNGNWIHAWDWKDRLTSSRHLIIGLAEGNREDQSVAYSYDEQKQRIVKHDVTGNKTTAYVEKYFDQEGNTQKAYIFAGGSKVASLEITPNGQNQPQTHLIFHHEDHLTGANVDTNADGQVIQLLDYFPYGDSRIDESAQGYHNDYEFTGKERDQETDLLYYEARYYNSAIGRFISRDTWQGDIKDPQSLNKYSYVRNNPLRLVDPDGQAFVDYVNAAGGYAVGFSQGVGAFAVGTANSMAHPVQTFNQIGNAGSAAGQWTNGFVRSYQTDPQGTLNSIAGSLNSAISSFESKSAYEQGKAIGNIFGQIDAGVAASGLTGQALKTSSVLDRPMYRGGSDMTARPGIDVKVDVNGMVDSNRGITVYDDPTHPNVIKFGGPYEIRRLPNGLEVIQRGQDLTHHEIVSTRPTLFNRYQSLLNDIKTKAIR